MNTAYSIKIAAYRFFNSAIGKLVLKALSPFVRVTALKKGNEEKKFPFIVAITIDTESGYIDGNDFRIWQKQQPDAYIGYYDGIKNWRNLLNKHNAKATFFLSTNCFSAKREDYKKIIAELKKLDGEKHEIGLHMHPDSDLALQSFLKRKFKATSAKFYSKKEINDLVSAGKMLIKKHIGITPISFRWGNWALNSDAVDVLEKSGFKIDSSAAPGTSGHENNEMEYDWSKTDNHYPWNPNKENYQIAGNSKVLEIPIATFDFFATTLRADPANSILLNYCFDYYYKNADRSKKPFVFVIISHSTESTHKDGSKTKVIDRMHEFLEHAKRNSDVNFLNLKEAYDLIK